MTDRETTTLIPGLLVGLKTTLEGNVEYHTVDTAPDESVVPSAEMNTGTQVAVAAWNTTRVTKDTVEFEAAKKVRSKARALITGVCASSNFGLLCPERNIDELRSAVADARSLVAAFNATSRVTKVTCSCIFGRIASNDVEAAQEINAELRDLIEAMRRGCEQLDPAKIREAAGKARDIGVMLTPAMQERVDAAIKLARTEARRLVKSGESAAVAVDRAVVDQLAFARSAFLDLDATYTIAAPRVDAADRYLKAEADPHSGAARTQPPEYPAAELDVESTPDYLKPLLGRAIVGQGDYDIEIVDADTSDSEED